MKRNKFFNFLKGWVKGFRSSRFLKIQEKPLSRKRVPQKSSTPEKKWYDFAQKAKDSMSNKILNS